MTYDWLTIAQCAELLEVPTESVQHLVNCGLVRYSINGEFRTCVCPAQVARVLAANARSRLEGLKVPMDSSESER